MKPYVIKQGDYLLKVAHILGFDPDQVWNDPKNAELKKLRKDPKMLVAGDILFIPDEPKKGLQLNAKQANAFVAKVPMVKSKVVIAVAGKPWANEKYVIEGLGDDVEHTPDGDGNVSFEAPVHVREVVVRFVDKELVFQVGIGDLDPIGTDSGARMRLTHLGFYGASVEGADEYEAFDDKQLAAAVAAFQAENGLPATGALDDATRKAIVVAHGS